MISKKVFTVKFLLCLWFIFIFGYVIVFANPNVTSEQTIQVDSAFVAPDDSSSPDIKIDESREWTDAQNVGVLQYVVQPGDNLIKIASKFGTTVSKIQKVNNIKDSTVNPGEMLVISDDNDGFLYTIPDNINVVVFANKYNLNVADFMSLNYIQDESEMLYQGQDVFVNLTQEQAYNNWLLQRPVIIPQEKSKPVIVKATPKPIKTIGTKPASKTTNSNIITNNPLINDASDKFGIIAQWVYKKDIKNSFYPGYCTWYAAIKSPNIFPFSSDNKQERIFGWNAREWCGNAKKAGFRVGTKPAVGALVVYKNGWRLVSAGHVGKVTKYYASESKMVIEDMNRIAKFVVTQRREDTDNGNISCYIYGK